MPSINQFESRICSQNGEDGIIAFLAGGIRKANRRFVEIGTSDGAENNSFHLLTLGWSGLGVEAKPVLVERYAARVRETAMARRLTLVAERINWDNCVKVVGEFGENAPDLFSLDIDGIDYYVAHRLLHAGFAPSLICCEFNPFLGAAPLTVVYDESFARYRYDPQRGLYYGASLGALQHLLREFGYRFCGVESAGVNAFFCREAAFAPGYLAGITGLPSAYSKVFVDKYGLPGAQLEKDLLARRDLVFVDVTQEDVAQLITRTRQKAR